MACIVCLAAIAAIGFAAGASLDEWMKRRLDKLAAKGDTTRETDSVITWRGEFPLVLDDGTEKLVSATIHVFKDSGRVKIHINDHSLTKDEAERLEDEIADALEAEIIDRRYPDEGSRDGALTADGEHTHAHDTESADDLEEPPLEEIEVEPQTPRR